MTAQDPRLEDFPRRDPSDFKKYPQSQPTLQEIEDAKARNDLMRSGYSLEEKIKLILIKYQISNQESEEIASIIDALHSNIKGDIPDIDPSLLEQYATTLELLAEQVKECQEDL